jgi:hypothetical protein
MAWVVALALTALARAAAGQEHEHGIGAGVAEHLGTVHFETTCSAVAQTQFDRAVALLHSFEFAPAIGDRAEAKGDYSRLLGNCERADKAGRPELVEARLALSR